MADVRWARLESDVNCRLRRGAWYRVAGLTSAEATLDVNREQVPVPLTTSGQVRAAGQGHELAAAKALLRQVPVAGRVVTADALLTQRDISEQIVAAGGDYLLPVDGNQSALHDDAETALSPLDAGRAPA